VPRWLLVQLAVSLAVLAIFAARPILFPPTNPRLTAENLQRLPRRAKRADIEAILGPPGDYRTRPTIFFPEATRIVSEPGKAYWEGDECECVVDEGSDGWIWYVRLRHTKPEPVGFFELLRWRWNHWWDSRR
jgi:hypothetical protein